MTKIFARSIAYAPPLLMLAACGSGQPDAAGGMGGPPGSGPPPLVEAITLRAQSVPNIIELPGRIEAVRTAEVRARADGIIERRLYQEGTDVRALSQSLAPPRADRTAVVLARTGAALGLRRRATVTASGVPGPDGSTGWDRLEVRFGWTRDLVEELLGYADAVVAESPEEVRREIVERLTGAVTGERP